MYVDVLIVKNTVQTPKFCEKNYIMLVLNNYIVFTQHFIQCQWLSSLSLSLCGYLQSINLYFDTLPPGHKFVYYIQVHILKCPTSIPTKFVVHSSVNRAKMKNRITQEASFRKM